MVEKGEILSAVFYLQIRVNDCKGNEEIAVFRPIRRGGYYKSEERINLFLRWLFYRIIGLYGKRWREQLFP